MQKRVSIEAPSLLVILSILTILVQFTAYRLFTLNIVIWGIACLISILCCHIFLGQTITYHICFDYSFLTLFISLGIILLTCFSRDNRILPYSNTMLGIAFINWLIPMLHCFLRNMLDYGTTVAGFNSFYRNSSIVFLIFYTGIIIYGNFSADAFGWAYTAVTNTFCFIPFKIITVRIGDYLNGSVPLSVIITYLASRILIYIPYGFYINLILRRRSCILRYLMLFVLPLLIEFIQYFTIQERCDIDDLIYALIGGLLGFFVFFLTNALYRAFSGKDFLMDEEAYRRYGSPLHF